MPGTGLGLFATNTGLAPPVLGGLNPGEPWHGFRGTPRVTFGIVSPGERGTCARPREARPAEQPRSPAVFWGAGLGFGVLAVPLVPGKASLAEEVGDS